MFHRLRNKLAVALALPLLLLLVVAGLAVSSSLSGGSSVSKGTYLATALLALLALGLGLLFLWWISASILRPLSALARAGQEVADTQLPAAVGALLNADPGAPFVAPQIDRLVVSGHDELAAVADALNAVHQRALDLAVDFAADQSALRRNVAEAFTNLGRRNQNLVARQLDLITQLEQNEDDPSTMEELFRLDHLATRMRRNAESLLVMAGIGAGSRWADAASAVDVVRAASAGVEDYRRLQLRHFDHAVIAAAATGDVVHILAELMENALSFSPPHAVVELYGRAQPRGYTISVVDTGIGMTAEERESANARLQGGGNLSDTASRYLGLVVAGRLAARHGISVTLHDADAGGISARLRIPPELVESSVVGPLAAGSAPASFTGLTFSTDQPPTLPVSLGPELTTVPALGPDCTTLPPLAADPTPLPAPWPDPTTIPAPGPDPTLLPALAGLTPLPALAGPLGTESFTWPSPPTHSPDEDGLLPRRVPGAALPYADDALRRAKAPVPPPGPQALWATLSDYLNIRSELSANASPSQDTP